MVVQTKIDDSNYLVPMIQQAVQTRLEEEIREIVNKEFDRIAARVTSEVSTWIFHHVEARMMNEDRLVIEVRLGKETI